MNKLFVAAAGVVVSLIHVGSVRAAPAWCKGASLGSSNYSLEDLSSEDVNNVFDTFVRATCTPTPEADASRAQIEKARQAWTKKLNMIEADWADAVAYTMYGKTEYHQDKPIIQSTNDFAALTPLDQYVVIAEGFNGTDDVASYLADAMEPQLSEVGRYAFIQRCLGARSSEEVVWAMCQGDIERFDPVKFSAQLRADTAHGGEIRMAMRLRAYNLPAQLKEHKVKIAALLKSDAAYKTMFDLAGKGRAEWSSGVGADTKLVELAQKMDSATFAHSRKLYEGCEEPTKAALVAAVSKVPAKTFAGMKDVRTDPYSGVAKGAGPALMKFPAVNLAAIPFILCHRKSGIAEFLAYYLREGSGQRGPRTAALSKIASEDIVFDDLSKKLSFPTGLGRPYRGPGAMSSMGGAVAKVTVKGDVLSVDLEKLLVKRTECIESHKTNRIERIRPDGSIEYQQVCDKSGVVTHDETWSEFEINKDFAPLLKKGVLFSAVGTGGAPMEILAIWSTKSAVNPSYILGAAVK